MKKICLIVLLCVSAFTTAVAGELRGFTILPKPQNVEIGRSSVLSAGELSYVVVQGEEMPVLGAELGRLRQSEIKGRKGVVLKIVEDGVPESKEGYVLKITKNGVVIESRNKVGLFYGCVTLEQMLVDCRDLGLKLPEVTITDYPQIEYRAVYFDNKHHLSRTKYYYDMIDKLAQYKINAVIWEIEDKLRYERRPEVGAPNALSIQELRAISRYAIDRNVEISPLIQGLGHAGFILKHHWELREKETSDWEFCPADPRTYELQFDLYKDAMDAFPYGRYLHVGGDEITAIGIDKRCLETGKSPFELQMMWLGKVSNFVVENGRTPIFWDDMPLKYGGIWWLIHGGLTDEQIEEKWNTEKLDKAINLFPKECIYMRWHYENPKVLANEKVLEWYGKSGLRVMAATGASTGETPFMARDDSRAQNICNFSQLVAENNLEGILSTAWDDGSAHWETVLRGYVAQGEYGWNPTGRTVEEFKTAHAQREWGLKNNEHIFLDNLEDLAFYFDGALVESGRRNPAYQVREFKLVDLPNLKKPGEWTEKYAEKLADTKEAMELIAKIDEQLIAAQNNALRGRYTLDIYRENLNQFTSPALLLLALEQIDQATTPQQQKNAKENLRQTITNFHKMRAEFDKVYSVTRFMEQPNGYIADMNHHMHLSALTMNSDWVFLYELAMINSIERSAIFK